MLQRVTRGKSGVTPQTAWPVCPKLLQRDETPPTFCPLQRHPFAIQAGLVASLMLAEAEFGFFGDGDGTNLLSTDKVSW